MLLYLQRELGDLGGKQQIHHVKTKMTKNRRKSYLSCKKVNDFEAVLHDANGQELLAVVATVHHQGVDETLNDGALGLAETLGSITSSTVWKIASVLLADSDVILERDVRNADFVAAPTSEQLNIGLWLDWLGGHDHWGLIVFPTF